MKLTLGQAAKAAEVNKATLSRYIKQGKISAEKQQDGSYRIEPSELDRLKDMRVADNRQGNPHVQQSVTFPATHALQVEISLLRERLQEKDRVIDDLREERDAWRQQLQSQTLLLTDDRQKKAPSLWGWLTGRQ
jgi:DNA-binding transcriptional MerR regulator